MLRHNDLLRTDGLNTVTFSNPYAKLCFTTMITRALTESPASSQNNIQKRVLYLDTDTTFTAYLMAGLILRDNYPSSDDIIRNHKNSSDDRDYNSNNDNNKNKGENDDNNDDAGIISAKINNRDERLVQVFLSSEGRFESLLGDTIASMPDASIVIFDSLNSFYNMYPAPWYESQSIEPSSGKIKQPSKKEMQIRDGPRRESRANQKKPNISKEENTDPTPPTWEQTKKNGVPWSTTTKSPYTIGRLNHLLSIFIMLLVQHGIYYKVPVLVTSMVRYKKVSEDIWVKAPACRRLLNQKSVVRLSVEMLNDNDLCMNIMKHPTLDQQTIVYPNVGISLVSP